MGHVVLQIGVSHDTSEEAAHVVGDEEQVADELALVVVQSHVVVHVRLAVGQEEEVSVVGTLLAPDPHDPNEHGVEVCQHHVVEVDDPEDKVGELDDSGDVRPLQRNRLQRG